MTASVVTMIYGSAYKRMTCSSACLLAPGDSMIKCRVFCAMPAHGLCFSQSTPHTYCDCAAARHTIVCCRRLCIETRPPRRHHKPSCTAGVAPPQFAMQTVRCRLAVVNATVILPSHQSNPCLTGSPPSSSPPPLMTAPSAHVAHHPTGIVVSIASGDAHSLAVTADGAVFTYVALAWYTRLCEGVCVCVCVCKTRAVARRSPQACPWRRCHFCVCDRLCAVQWSLGACGDVQELIETLGGSKRHAFVGAVGIYMVTINFLCLPRWGNAGGLSTERGQRK